MSQAKQFCSREELPLVLQQRHITQILGASPPTVYNLFKTPGFPVVRIGERRFVVPRDQFFAWLEKQAHFSA